jgi:predicted nucleic acid-binding protein
VKYVDASALLRILLDQKGERAPLSATGGWVSSTLIEVETNRAIDRARLLGILDDAQTATKRNELGQLLARIDRAPIDGAVIDRAKAPFAVLLRTLDAIHVAAAENLRSAMPEEPFEFWTHDERQAIAATSRGLTVRGI